MYINTQILNSKELSFTQLILLQLCKQQKFEDHSEVIEKGFYPEDIDFLLSRGLIEEIKGTKQQSKFEKLRCSKSGCNLLDIIEIPEISEQDILLYDWISSVYLKNGKELGNRKKGLLHLTMFRVHSSIDKNRLAFLLKTFLEDENQMNFSNVLQYVFFKPDSIYSTRFDIEGSRLYKYYLNRRDWFEAQFEKL